MLADVHFGLTLVSALGCGLIGGVFFAFSSFVMGALARLPPAQGIAAMQSINVLVLNRTFLPSFLGTAAASVLLIGLSLYRWSGTESALLVAGGALYLLGTFLVTIAFNVPRNNALEEVDAESAEGADVWARYVPEWTAWNSVRTVAALAASVLLMLGLVSGW